MEKAVSLKLQDIQLKIGNVTREKKALADVSYFYHNFVPQSYSFVVYKTKPLLFFSLYSGVASYVLLILLILNLLESYEES